MNKLLLPTFISLVLFTFSCKQKSDCSNIPAKFSSYNEALAKIQSSSFKIKEEANTSNSSWIRGASFYSCDGNKGFFILQTDKSDYLYSNMPYDVWSKFKNAKSLGKYYNENIKHHFTFQLTK